MRNRNAGKNNLGRDNLCCIRSLSFVGCESCVNFFVLKPARRPPLPKQSYKPHPLALAKWSLDAIVANTSIALFFKSRMVDSKATLTCTGEILHVLALETLVSIKEKKIRKRKCTSYLARRNRIEYDCINTLAQCWRHFFVKL